MSIFRSFHSVTPFLLANGKPTVAPVSTHPTNQRSNIRFLVYSAFSGAAAKPISKSNILFEQDYILARGRSVASV